MEAVDTFNSFICSSLLLPPLLGLPSMTVVCGCCPTRPSSPSPPSTYRRRRFGSVQCELLLMLVTTPIKPQQNTIHRMYFVSHVGKNRARPICSGWRARRGRTPLLVSVDRPSSLTSAPSPARPLCSSPFIQSAQEAYYLF